MKRRNTLICHVSLVALADGAGPGRVPDRRVMTLTLIFNFMPSTIHIVGWLRVLFERCRPTASHMIVCHCKGLSDRDIRKAVREGAVSCADVSRFCSAGTDCGGCRPLIDEIIHKETPALAHEPGPAVG